MKEFNTNTHFRYGPPIIRIDEADISKVILTSDWHLYHKNIIRYSKRPFNDLEEMKNHIISVTKAEIEKLPTFEKDGELFYDGYLINCGDIAMWNNEKKYTDVIENDIDKVLGNVRKYYCLGNHDIQTLLATINLMPGGDAFKDAFFNTQYIIEVYRDKKLKMTFTISHQPLTDPYGSFNLHGHLHTPSTFKKYMTEEEIGELSKVYDSSEQKEDRHVFGTLVKWSQSTRHYDVGLDYNNYRPIWLKDIINLKENGVVYDMFSKLNLTF